MRPGATWCAGLLSVQASIHNTAMLCGLAFYSDRMPSATMPYFFSLPLTCHFGV